MSNDNGRRMAPRLIRDPKPAKSDPIEAEKIVREKYPEAHSSRSFIARFERADKRPAHPDNYVTMEEFTTARNKQIVAITRKLLPEATTYATDIQVLRLWSNYMKGLY